MRKIIFILVALLSLGSSATISAQSRLAIVGGADLTTLKFNQNLFTVDQSLGYSIGVMGELMLPGIGFGVDASMLYTQRGATLHLGQQNVWSSIGYGTVRSYLHYLEIPINLKFKYTNLNGIENTIAPLIFVGPTINVLLAHNKVDALKYPGADIGVHVGVGCELYKKVQVTGSYEWGLTYALQTKLLDGFSAKNRTWKVSVAYFF